MTTSIVLRTRRSVVCGIALVTLASVAACHGSDPAAPGSTVSGASTHGSSTDPVASLGPSDADECAPSSDPYPLGRGDDDDSEVVRPALASAILVQAHADQDGTTAVEGLVAEGKPRWTLSGQGELSFAQDSEVFNSEGAADVTVYARRALVDETFVDLATGAEVATLPSRPLAVSDICQAVVIYDDGTLALLRATGQEAWTAPMAIQDASRARVHFGGPGDDRVVVFDGDMAAAIDTTDGTLAWSRPLGQHNWSVSTAGVSSAGDDGLTVYDANTGVVLMHAVGQYASGWVSDNGAVFGCSKSDSSDHGVCRVWSTDGTLGATVPDTSGIVDLGAGYVAVSTTGELRYFESPTATEPTWSVAGPSGMLPNVSTSWSLAGDDLVVPFDTSNADDGAATSGAVVSISTTTGQLNWSYTLADDEIDEVGVWTDLATGEVLVYPTSYLDPDSATTALDLTTGQVAWTSPTQIVGAATDRLLLGDASGQILALDTNTGKQAWETSPAG